MTSPIIHLMNNNNSNNKREVSTAPQNAEANSEAQIIAHRQDA